MPQSENDQRRSGLLLRPAAGIGLGLVAGLLVWGLVQMVHPVFQMPRELHLAMGSPRPLVERHRAAQRQIDRRHAMLYLGCLGAVIGLALGFGESATRRTALPVVLATPLGAGGGVAGGLLACLVQEYVRANVGLAEIQHTVAAQLALALPLAGCIGLGLGLATRSLSGCVKTLFAGLAGGVLAAVVYPLIASVLFPNISTDSLMPDEAGSRLLWLSLLAGSIGLVVPVAGRRRQSASPSPDRPAT